jgi:hypothetical protein
MAQSHIIINWGDDKEMIQSFNALTLTPLTPLTSTQMWNLFHVSHRKCDIAGREREEGEVDDDEYND